MIKYYLVILVFSFQLIQAQTLPRTIYLTGEDKLKKTIAENPSGNAVFNILTIGDTIWLGTSRGVNLSTDNGTNWQSFYGSSAFGTEEISAIGYDNGLFLAGTWHPEDLNGESLPVGSGLKYTTNNGLTWASIPEPKDDSTDKFVRYGINSLNAVPTTVYVQNLIYNIAVTHTINGNPVIWIAAFAGGLRRSYDMGASWQRVVLPPDNLNSIKPTDSLNFCLSPVGGKICSDNNYNYRVFSIIPIDDSTLYVGTAGGLNKTSNARDTFPSWVKFNHVNQDHPISGNFVFALGYNRNRLWSATLKADGETEHSAVGMSSDGGSNWISFLDGEEARTLGFTTTGDVIAPTNNGAFRSSNNGTSWILPGNIMDKDSKIPLPTLTFFSAASNSNDIWLGSADGLVKLSETPGLMWQGEWKIYFGSQKLSSTGDSYAYPNPFSPRMDVLKIKYSTGGNNSPVTIRIFDFGMNYVRTIIQNASRGNPLHVIDGSNSPNNGVIDYWDGKDDSGYFVPNGVYFYRIEFNSGNPLYGKIIVLQ
jgi:hypothetical protein